MSFTSWHFAIFLPVVFLLFHAVPGKLKFWVMLFASLYFYMSWQPIFILVLFYSTLVSYASAYPISRATSDKTRRLWLWLGVALTLAPLMLFKYFNFLNEQIGLIAGSPKPFDVTFALPIGISFFTFQALSYIIDVYRHDAGLERSLPVYTLYKAFFPQLVAGPIERATHLLPQMSDLARRPWLPKFAFNDGDARDGLRLILWGLFKKLVIADNLAVLVDELFTGYKAYSGPMLLVGAYFFAYQIYCDFSGYTDIARGCAKLFGFDLMENFRSPYRSRSIHEFWQRWHISLSTWFRDYVYRPLGGNRVSFGQWTVNILLVFLLSGLWHGANWTFLVWGGLHAFYYIFGRLTERHRHSIQDFLRIRHLRIWHVAQTIGTFNLVAFAWIFFRADDVRSAMHIAAKILLDVPEAFGKFLSQLARGQAAFNETYLANLFQTLPHQFSMFWNGGTMAVVLMVFLLETVDYLRDKPQVRGAFLSAPVYLRWTSYYALAIGTVVMAPFGSKQFIYFQF